MDRGRAHSGRETVCSRARMSWTLPTPLLLFAGVVALLPLARLLRRPASGPRLMVEAFVTALAVRRAGDSTASGATVARRAGVIRVALKHQEDVVPR